MKYLFLRTRKELKNNILKFYIIQIIFLLIYLIINKKTIPYIGLDDYCSILGLCSIKNLYFMYTLIKLISYFVIIHLIIKIFLENILKNIQYIMLRLDNTKWILYEILGFIFYTIIMRIIYNIILYIFLKVFQNNIMFSDALLFIVKDILFFINILLLTVLVLNLFSYNDYKKTYTLLPFVLIIVSLFVNISNCSVIILVAFILLFLLLNVISFIPSRFYTRYCNK